MWNIFIINTVVIFFSHESQIVEAFVLYDCPLREVLLYRYVAAIKQVKYQLNSYCQKLLELCWNYVGIIFFVNLTGIS